MKHIVKVIPKEEILANRSNAYEFIDMETFEEYVQRLKDRCIEDNYKYTDEDFIKYKEYIINCWNTNLSVYKCLEFMWFETEEGKNNFKELGIT